MKLFNIRLGHANNSSSSHSLIFLPPGITYQDTYQTLEGSGGDFDQDLFILTSSQAKTVYLATLLYENLLHRVTPEIALAVVRDWMNLPDFNPKSSIDHQSVICFPIEKESVFGINKKFYQEFCAYVTQSHIAICGGSDQSTNTHPIQQIAASVDLSLPKDERPSYQIARKDPIGEYWTLFNRQNGTKIRCSFNPNTQLPIKAFAPELVDLKITDFCQYGCQFCYQDSTPTGKHASYSVIKKIVNVLAELDVFEIALGGGEPTDHPQFLDILKYIHQAKINANFTTKNFSWLRSSGRRKEIFEYATSIAFSVDKPNQIDTIARNIEKIGIDSQRITIQIVMGLHSAQMLNQLLTKANQHDFNLMLLGYKQTGRGPEVIPTDYTSDEFIQTATAGIYRLGIDTKLAQDWSPYLFLKKIPTLFYHTEEGKFSCYIDAVASTMGASSYSNSFDFVRFDTSEGILISSFLQNFARF